MKKNKFTLGWFFISLLMAFCVTACDDDDENIVSVTFPEKQSIGGQAGDQKQLSFNASADWQLVTSSTWCSFETANGYEYSLAGKAGEQTINLRISDEGQDYDSNSIALLTLRMNGQEAVIAEVTRNALNRQLTVFKKADNGEWVALAEGESIEAPRLNLMTQEEKAYNYYMVRANFRFAASERPEWLAIKGGSVVGSINQDVVFGVKSVDDKPGYYKYAQKGNLTFQDEEGKSYFTFPVSYAGMDAEALYYEGPDAWNWEVALDGKTFVQTSAGIAGTEEVSNKYNKFVEYSVTAFNDDFEAIFVERYELSPGYFSFKTSIPSEEAPEELVDWMHLNKYDNGKVRVTVDEGSSEREGYVLVFPKALYDKIAADPWGDNGLFETDPSSMQQELKYEYTQNNLLMNFVQKEQKQEGGDDEKKGVEIISQYFENWGEVVECTELTGDEAEYYKSEYYAAKVYTTSAKACASVQINVPFEVNSFFAEYNKQDVTDTYCGMPEDGKTTAVDVFATSYYSTFCK